MAKQIIWSSRAKNDKYQILKYWIERNKSNTYSKKLEQLFNEAINIIQKYPQIGKPVEDEKLRIRIIRDYLIIYQESEKGIYILTIWDSRQNPDNLLKNFK